MFRTTLFCSLLLTTAILAQPAAAQDDEWRLRFGGVWVDPDVSFSDVDSDGDRVEAGADSEIGFSLALERRFSPRLGLELGALFVEPDVNISADLADGARVTVSDGVGVTAITAGLNIHLTPDKAMDVYFGPMLGYVSFSDVGFRVQADGETLDADFSSNDEFALGAQIGADIPLGDGPWSLNLAAKYLDVSLKVTDSEGEETDLGFDPLILGVGIGYSF